MTLIDAVYVNYGGAIKLLQYLIDSVRVKRIPFFLLADKRCEGMFHELTCVLYIKANEKNRLLFYSSNRDSFSSVFCFGNVPPPIHLKIPVYTYFHNINMLTLADCRSLKQKIVFRIKRQYIRFLHINTTEWFVQTVNTANELINHLGIPYDLIKLFPFYKLPRFVNTNQQRTDYVFVGEYSGSKGHDELLEAWKYLHNRGIDLTLHLTVSKDSTFLLKVHNAIQDGVQIVNHGYIPAVQLSELFSCSIATVYPSYNESFGLGLVEALEAGCDVIASDRPYVYAVCKPSEVFLPEYPESIAEAILRYETGKSNKSELLVNDKIEELINRITGL